MTARVLLDISRLLSRARRGPQDGAPTGIDRVEMAYARELLAQSPERVTFVAIDQLDRLCALPQIATQRFIALLAAHWAGQGPAAAEVSAAARMIWIKAVLGYPPLPQSRAARYGTAADRPIYLLLSHRHLHRRSRLNAVLAATGARLVVFVHDLIPIDFPEYCRAQQAELHRKRIETVAALADTVIVNSRATAAALQPFLLAAGRDVPVLVAPLGVDRRLAEHRAAPNPEHAGPHFICLSTIEPRKNHLLLLHIWRRLDELMGPAAPHLYLVGRRGWENENVIDMLERSPAIRRHVTECRGADDARVASLLRTSRALLFPSFAEGFGLPIAEALSAGTPVICSDLPALRETGGTVPDYLDPLDAHGWMAAITDYAAPGSLRRRHQLARATAWRAPCWREHLAEVMTRLEHSSRLKGDTRRAGAAFALAEMAYLALRREFASTNYTAAQAAFENAKLQALRQQLFVVRVVEPNMPQSALYPRSYVIIATVFLVLLLSYGIGWLILAGVREHAA